MFPIYQKICTMDNTEVFYSRVTSKFRKLFSLILHKSSQKVVHILAGEVVKTQKRTRNSTFSSVRSKRTSLLLMFKEHKRYFCTFSLIKYLTKTPQTRTRYSAVPDTRGGYNAHFYNSNIILLYSRNQQYHICVNAFQVPTTGFYKRVRKGRPESTVGRAVKVTIFVPL
jgi:hypothetical protein